MNAPAGLVRLAGPAGVELACFVGTQAWLATEAVPLCDAVLQANERLLLPDVRQDPRFAGHPLVLARPVLGFYAGVPIHDCIGRPIGTLCVLGADPRAHPTAADLALLDELAQSVSGRLEQLGNAALIRDMACRAALMERLLTATAEAPDFMGALRAAGDALCQAASGTFCNIWRLDAAKGSADLIASSGSGAVRDPCFLSELRSLHLTAENSPVCRALVTGQQSVISDVQAVRGNYPALQQAARRQVVALVSTPFSVGEQRCAFSVGFEETHVDLDVKAALLADATLALRPLLRRHIDEASATLFRRAVEASNEVVLITDSTPYAEGGPHIIFMNQAGERETGYAVAEVLGRTPRMFQGAGTSREALANIRTALADRRSVRQELVNYRKDGTSIIIELTIAPVTDEAGRCTHYVSVQRDVSLRKAAEQQAAEAAEELEALIGAMPGAVTRFRHGSETGWSIHYASASITPLTGLLPDEFVAGHLQERLPADDLAALHAALDRAADDGRSSVELTFRQPDGRARIILGQLHAHPLKDGTPEIIMGWTDITSTREMAHQLVHSAKLAQLGELATCLAHELNQPLAGITLAAENSLRALRALPGAQPRVLKKLDLIVELATRTSGVIDHMRVFGRSDPGSAKPIRLSDLVFNAARLLQGKLKGHGVELIVADLEAAPALLGKPLPLEQVLINLIVNACDAYRVMPDPPPPAQRKVCISASRQADRLQIVVADRAGGIDADILPRIFEPFFTTKAEGDGTGIGLSISSKIIAEMGGTLGVEVRDGGTAFTILLPLAPD